MSRQASLLAASVTLAFTPTAFAQWGWTALASRAFDGSPANGSSSQPVVSHDGRYVAYVSSASNVVSDDTNGVDDIFVCDLWFGGSERVNVSSSGAQADQVSGGEKVALSDDGRFVLFASRATNLVPGDTNNFNDLFLRDRQLGTTRRVSVDGAGAQVYGNSDDGVLSGDGRFAACDSDAPQLWPNDTNFEEDVIVFDLVTGVPTCASVAPSGQAGNGESLKPAISGDGRWVAFTSSSSDLVAGDTNAAWDTFLRDLQSGVTTRVSVDSSGQQGNAMSNWARVALSYDGRYVAFLSLATNLVVGDSNGVQDVFVHDRLTGITERVSTDSSGAQANAASSSCSLSADGRYVTFGSYATNLVAGDTNGAIDVFVKDRVLGTTVRVSLDDDEHQGNGSSTSPRISGDGRVVVFQSIATDLVPGDTNDTQDVFARLWQQSCGPNVGTYCVALINTTGEGAQIESLGSTEISNNDFALRATHCPPLHPGIFFFGCYQTSVPFGEGMLCVTGQQHRLPLVRADASGVATYALDFTDPLSSAAAIEPDTTWNFQFWYRDPQPVGHGFNLSNALSAQFCP